MNIFLHCQVADPDETAVKTLQTIHPVNALDVANNSIEHNADLSLTVTSTDSEEIRRILEALEDVVPDEFEDEPPVIDDDDGPADETGDCPCGDYRAYRAQNGW